MMVLTPRRIEDVYYATHQQAPTAPPMDVLAIEIDNGEVLRVPNTGWVESNPALQVLAYLGVTPSTMDDAVGKALPVSVARHGEGEYSYAVARMVFDHGYANLSRSAWFVPAADGGTVAVEDPNSNSGGSGGDPAA